VGVLTISDRVSQGVAVDQSGPLIVEMLEKYFEKATLEIERGLLPDEKDQIRDQLRKWCYSGSYQLVLTTGGTGFSPRDVTPEATKEVIDRETPGLTIAMMNESLKCTPHAALSRLVSGISGSTLVVNLPGSTKAVRENMQVLLPLLPHSISLLQQRQTTHSFKDNQTTKSVNAEESKQVHIHSGCGRDHSKDIPNPARVSPWPMVPVPQAINIILDTIKVLQPINIQSTESIGYILSEDVKSTESLPPFRASMKDGFAVTSSDGKGEYNVVDSIMAGTEDDFKLTKGNVMRITTGAPLPEGADAVVMVERTSTVSINPEVIKIYDNLSIGQDIRPIGSDIHIGQTILQKDTLIGGSDIGLLSTIGCNNIMVYGLPSISILSTGDEIQESTTVNLDKGSIRDSNRPMLISTIKSLYRNINIIDLGISKDNKEDIKNNIMRGINNTDIVITSGGVSMGELDLIEPVLKDIGANIHFGRILMKPGKPFTYATMEVNGKRKYIFGLPGNPVSVMVTFYLLIVPSIRKLSGHNNPNLTTIRVKLGHDFRMDPERPEYHRCRLEYSGDNITCHSTGNQSSCRLLSMYNADALVHIPQGDGVRLKGTFLEALLIPK